MTTKQTTVKKETSQEDFSELVLTNRDCYFIRDNFGLLKGLVGFIFVREANRNLDMIEKYIKSLTATIEPSEEYKNGYLKDLAELEIKYADKDENENVLRDRRGNPLINTNVLQFNEEVKSLQKKHKEHFDIHETKIKEFNENFDEPAAIKLYTFSEKQVPPNISMEQYRVIMHMIDFSKGISSEEGEEDIKSKKEKK